jgi:hypothetical protein
MTTSTDLDKHCVVKKSTTYHSARECYVMAARYRMVQSTSAIHLSSEKKGSELMAKRRYRGYSLISVHCTLIPARNFNELKITVF